MGTCMEVTRTRRTVENHTSKLEKANPDQEKAQKKEKPERFVRNESERDAKDERNGNGNGNGNGQREVLEQRVVKKRGGLGKAQFSKKGQKAIIVITIIKIRVP